MVSNRKFLVIFKKMPMLWLTGPCFKVLNFLNFFSSFFFCDFALYILHILNYLFNFPILFMMKVNTRFAVNSANNVMTPKDASITTVGGDNLSVLDIKKLSAGYSCSVSSYNYGCVLL